jgi:GNAT superfamily N-acetyltransferase
VAERGPIDPSPEGLASLQKLLRLGFPQASHLTAAYLDWAYLQNPSGRALGCNAYAGAEPVAHLAMQPFEAEIEGRRQRGVMAHNLVTHPAHRGRGLFTRIAEQSLRAATESGFDFAMAIVNQNSTPGFVRKLGYQLVCPLDARLGIGTAPDGEGCEPQYRRLWSRETLAWRLGPPHRPYRVRPSDGCRTVFADTGSFGIQVQLGRFPAELLPGDLPALGGGNPVRLWIGLDPGRRGSRSAYVNLPLRLRPSPLNFVFLDLTGQGRTLDPNRIAFRAVDFDAY